jgi:hypothetical protein
MNNDHREPILNAGRRGFYVARRETPPAIERVWPWILLAAAMLGGLAAMAR